MDKKDIVGMIRNGRLDMLKSVPVNDFYPIETVDGGLPILVAAKYGRLGICRYLIEQGARVDARITTGLHKGLQPIHLAARRGDLALCRFLVERGADVDAVVEYGGVTALEWARKNGHFEVCQYLLEKGAIDNRAPD